MNKQLSCFSGLLALAGILLIWPFDSSLNETARNRSHNYVSGEQIIEEMYERYHESWYRYLTFEQQTDFFKNGEKSDTQTWYEALHVPGKLVIKFDSLRSGTGVIFRQDSQYVFQNSLLVRKMPRVHDLMVLGFDVYRQDPATTISTLKQKGYDLERTYETEWQDRPVYVIGVNSPDEEGPQFWIDREHLYFVRLLKTNLENGLVQETQFNNYERIGGGWVAPEVLFFNNGQLVMKELYSNLQVPEHLSERIFDLKDFEDATW